MRTGRRPALAAGESPQVHRLLGTAYGISGELGKSVLHLRAAVRLNPADERSWLALARTLESSGRLTEAADALRQGIDKLPDAGAPRWRGRGEGS